MFVVNSVIIHVFGCSVARASTLKPVLNATTLEHEHEHQHERAWAWNEDGVARCEHAGGYRATRR